MDQFMKKLYEEIGVNCPFLLAEHQGVKLAYFDDLGDCCGLYKVTGANTYRIFLNASIDLDAQLQTACLLIRHHNVEEQKGTERWISKNDLKTFNKVEKATKRFNRVLEDLFINNPNFGRNDPQRSS